MLDQWMTRGIFSTAPKYKPNISAIVMADPRTPETADLGVCAFYYPGKNEPCDDVCQGYIFGNFWEEAGAWVEIDGVRFRTAEGAFQAMKFWPKAKQFSELAGGQVFSLKKQLELGGVDRTYNGRGNNWKAMLEVLRAKFRPGSRLAEALLATGEAFMLEHNSTVGRDQIWSNNHIGDGRNWLGLQLMLVRDELRLRTASITHRPSLCSWTDFFRNLVDLESGEPLASSDAQRWRRIVQVATDKVRQQLSQGSVAEICKRPGCSLPTFDGNAGYCTKTCKRTHEQSTEVGRTKVARTEERPICLRSGCCRPTYNGQPGEFCSLLCRDYKVQLESAADAGKAAAPPAHLTMEAAGFGGGQSSSDGWPAKHCGRTDANAREVQAQAAAAQLDERSDVDDCGIGSNFCCCLFRPQAEPHAGPRAREANCRERCSIM
mmetsp:Transcript_26013/g.57203  ORF Transcript_26013/g.57203 Transcript_26013/m.57203 type:complete len:433 (-) Transcript_26013:83-1381(-)